MNNNKKISWVQSFGYIKSGNILRSCNPVLYISTESLLNLDPVHVNLNQNGLEVQSTDCDTNVYQ